ncbi:MAG: hypothetical protein WCC21_09565 [Candidatus Acidiferrales bacterium]
MRYLRIFAVLGLVFCAASFAHAQRVVVGVGVGGPAPIVAGPPVCSYGYYSYAPYACAPYGYYGPEWFSSGVFIGAGPWFHGYYGHPGFYGRPGWGGRGFVGRPGFGPGPARGPVGGFHGSAVGGFHGRGAGGFHGGAVAHGGGGFHGGGGRR